jgi:exodeoxyribonuclease-5
MTRRWSPQQEAALKDAGDWLKTCQIELRFGRPLSRQIFRLFGFAGTGKTTLARHLAEHADGPPCYCAFTGKAALMMQRNGCAGASTIHSLIYQVRETPSGGARFILDADSAAREAGVIVVDEVSMVGEDLARDLMSFGRPILVLGDPAQLPPVSGAGFFINARADAMLTEIHRQAAESPIIRLATTVREGGKLVAGTYADSKVLPRGILSAREVASASQVLVGKNVTRRSFNARLRAVKGFESDFPEPGDRLVCLYNDKTKEILNGGLFTVSEIVHRGCDGAHVACEVTSDDFPKRPPVEVKVRREFFTGRSEDLSKDELKGTQRFDFGYALTCHKAQGSQWPDVVIYDESGTFRDDAARWLYTALTRAQDRVTVVV